MEAFQLADDMRKFLSSYEPIPTAESKISDADQLALSNARISWRSRIKSAYELRFAERQKVIFLKFGEKGIRPDYSSVSPGVRRIEDVIPREPLKNVEL
jgi:hypothetical protein